MINIKNNDNKCFLWCHIRHLNLMSKNPQRITKEDKKLVGSRIMKELNFPISRKDNCKIEKQNNTCINVLKMDWLTQFMYQAKKLVIVWICC